MTADRSDPSRTAGPVSMNRELFGAFGGIDAFSRFADPDAFDVLVRGPSVTVGLRNPACEIDRRSAVHTCDRGACLLFGEVVAPDRVEDPAKWLFERYAEAGREALSALNGSYLCVVDVEGSAFVVTDPLRTWECFYLDAAGTRVFGTDVARLGRLVETPRVDRTAALELLHVGTVFGERTLFESIDRVPHDSRLTPTGVDSLDRFVYDPAEFDYVGELAARLGRAIERRQGYPGRVGVLLSGGKDSRVFLSQLSDVDETYTVGARDSREVRVARRVAEQYGAGHTALEPDGDYLYPTDDKLLYAQGVKEALHIHHAGYDDQIDADVMYHGLLFDTLFKGYFLERDGITVFGSKLPSKTPVSDPDVVGSLLDTLGFFPDMSERMADAVDALFDDLDIEVDLAVDSAREFLRDRLAAELDACWERADSPHNATDLLVVRNQPVIPFRAHLADNYLESFVAMDADLLEWHLRTPPRHRNADTFRRALDRLDDDILRHRPPSEPHDSAYLNHAERFVRRKLPLVEQFEPAWPNRQEVYARFRLDDRLFPDHAAVRDLTARQQLRVNDLCWWTEAVRDVPDAEQSDAQN
ncbi:MAG: asparagine synthase-related protein [Haloferacaceae archaeon]